MDDAILGLDIGTTSTKAVLFDLSGAELATAERAYRLHTPQPGWAELDPEELWQALLHVLRSRSPTALATRRTSSPWPSPPRAARCSRPGGTARPVGPILTWLDGRTEALVQRWKAEGIEERVRAISGWHLYPGLCLPTIAWLRQHQPDLFAAAEHFFSVNDFLVHRLTGRFCTNPSNGGGMQLLDVTTGAVERRAVRPGRHRAGAALAGAAHRRRRRPPHRRGEPPDRPARRHAGGQRRARPGLHRPGPGRDRAGQGPAGLRHSLGRHRRDRQPGPRRPAADAGPELSPGARDAGPLPNRWAAWAPRWSGCCASAGRRGSEPHAGAASRLCRPRRRAGPDQTRRRRPLFPAADRRPPRPGRRSARWAVGPAARITPAPTWPAP